MKILSLIVLASVLGYLSWTGLSSKQNSKPVDTHTSSDVSEHPNSRSELKTGFPLGCQISEEKTYSYRYNSQGALSNFKVSPDDDPVEAKTKLSFSGSVALSCFEKTSDTSKWRLQFKISDFSQESLSQTSFEKSQLEAAIAFEWGEKQGIVAIHFPKNISRESKYVFFDYLSHLSFKWLQSPTQMDHWISSQDLNSGKKEFQVRIENRDKFLQLTKSFESKSTGERYQSEYNFDPAKKQLVRFSLDYDQESKLETGALLTNNTTIQMQLDGVRKSPANGGNFLQGMENHNLAQFLETDTVQRIYKNELGELTAADLLNDLGKLKDKQNVTEYYKKYKSLFALESDSVQLFKQPLMELSPEDDRYQVLFLAMVKAGSPSIQNFLLSTIVVSDSISPEKKVVSLGLLGLLSNPTRETMQTVLHVAQKNSEGDVRNAGWLSVTNMARSTKEIHSDVTDKVSNALTSKSKADRNQTQILETLHAAGNLGDTRHVNLVKKALSSQALTTKQAGLLSLRFMDSEVAQPILLEYMSEEAESDLVMTAFEAASFHDLSPLMLQRLLKLSENAGNEQIRLASLQLLKQKYATAPSVIARAIDHSARYDESLQVRQFANSLTLSL